MREPTPLFTLLGIACYPYGAALALGLLLAALMAMASFRKAFGAAEDGLRFSLWALPLGFVGARLGYCAVKASFIAVDFGPAFLSHFGLGGYSMVGAFVGVLAASALFGRITRRGWLPTMGAAMPALLLAAALGRFAECLTTEGIGEYMDNPFWQFFPFAVPDLYGPWSRRWVCFNSDVFYSFFKHYYTIISRLLPAELPWNAHLASPGLIIIHAFLLGTLDSVVHPRKRTK